MPSRKSKSLADIEAQIEQLKKEAETIRQSERVEVIERIRGAIAHYDLTPAELGLTGGRKAKGAKAGASDGAPSGKSRRGGGARKPRAVGVIKYRDEAGHAWTGVGKRPRWFLDALAAGRTPEDLLVR